MNGAARMFVYRRLATPLHAARAGVGAIWSAALLIACFCQDSPLALAPLVATIVAAGMLAGVGRQLVRALGTAAIVAVPIVLVNVLVSRDGLTVFARLGDLGPFGQGDLTFEALVYGAVIALKVTILMLISTLASLAVDPDELLRGARRLSFRSGLTASLATRMLPVLAVDASRLADAQRTLPAARSASRGRLLGATVATSLDRAFDVAATLELRGFAHARRGARRRRPLSRHDLAFAASAGLLAAIAIPARLANVAAFSAYPEIHAGPPGVSVALGCLFGLTALLPFADRRGVQV